MRQRKPRKIGGTRLEQFFTRFYGAEPGLDPQHIAHLVQRSLMTFTSVRVRPSARLLLGSPVGEGPPLTRGPKEPVPPPKRPEPEPKGGDFDPYAIGLVPTYQREGRAGLLAKLGAIAQATHLRQMARAQQLALGADAKRDGISLDSLRDAIADAVEKRIKDRQAGGD